MFENTQATFLFLNALRSIEKNDSFNKDTNPVPESLNTLIKFVRMTMSYNKLRHEESLTEKQKRLLLKSQSLNAAALFAVLKASNITCVEFEKYYQSVDVYLPDFPLGAYIYLNYESDWSEFFIESARQLPSDVLATFCEKILLMEMDEQRRFYSWHLVLQSIIWKFFMMDDPELTCHNAYEVPSFDFPYSVPDSSDDIPSDDEGSSVTKSYLFKIYTMLLNELSTYAQLHRLGTTMDFDFLKVILHGFKLIFKLLRNINTFESGWVKELFKLNPLLEQCCEKSSESHLSSFLNFRQKNLTAVDICYLNAGWKINNYYLVFLICSYWEEVSSLPQHELDNVLSVILPLLPSDDNRRHLMRLNPLMEEYFDDSYSEVVDLLETSIHCNYVFYDRVAEIILSHAEVLNLDKVMKTLEENSSILCSLKYYKLLANAIVATKVPETKSRCLKLFYNGVSQASTDDCNEVIKHILHNWKVCGHFKLQDFDYQLAQFVRKTLSFTEAIQCLPLLFIQSPEKVLRTVIEQALTQGLEGMVLIQALKYTPFVCKFNNYDLIRTILSEYLNKTELSFHESQNMLILIKSLMEVHAEADIISFDAFVTTCVIPHFSNTQNTQLYSVLNCLNMAIKTLNEKNAFKISNNILLMLLKSIGLLIDSCIKSGNGRIKELVLVTITLLSNITGAEENNTLNDKSFETLLVDFKPLHPSTFVYTSHFLGIKTPKDLSYSPSDWCELIWTWRCSTNDSKFLEEIPQEGLSYENLLNILVKLLHHFTKTEWMQCTNYIKEYIKNWSSTDKPSSLVWKLSENNAHLYTIIRILMDALYVLFEQGINDTRYVSNCFTYTVMNLLNDPEVEPELLLTIFMDVCHLSLNTSADILCLFSSFLLGIKNSICLLCNHKACKDSYKKVLFHTVEALPDSKGRDNLLQKL